MDAVFEAPIWLALTLSVVGLCVLVMGLRGASPPMRRFGLAIAAVGILVGGVRRFVDTPRERAVKATRNLVDSFGRRDWPAFEALLAEEAQFGPLAGRPTLAVAARRAAEAYDPRELHVLSVEAVLDASEVAVVSLTVMARAGEGAAAPTSWTLEWVRVGPDWKLRRATPLGGPFVNPSVIEMSIRRIGR